MDKGKNNMMNNAIVSFLIKAKKATYAGKGAETTSTRPKSHDLVYSEGDYTNLIHRHNLTHYFLCKIKSFGDRNLTQDEIEDFHLSTLKMTYEEAAGEYEKRRETKLARLIANRELPILMKAKEIIDQGGY